MIFCLLVCTVCDVLYQIYWYMYVLHNVSYTQGNTANQAKWETAPGPQTSRGRTNSRFSLW